MAVIKMVEPDNADRVAGVLLPISSLPGGKFNGELGKDAFQFVDFLADSGLKIWQVLPLGPVMSDKSPYQSTSAHAGNFELISIDTLHNYEWVDQYALQQYSTSISHNSADSKHQLLMFLFKQFSIFAKDETRSEYIRFISDKAYWLDEYALYAAIKKKYENKSWIEWPLEVRERKVKCLESITEELSDSINYVKFVQFIFYIQWQDVKKYSNQKGIKIFGDLPLFVSHDSADVWSKKSLFKLDSNGQPNCVAGVPPDYFSETGQRWGNPVYDWKNHEADNFNWWINRLKTQFDLFDIVRIDHFRGLASYWEIPVECETALEGEWVLAPGEKMLSTVEVYFGKRLPLVAEDLGLITEQVTQLKDKFNFPGMKILQFAFGGAADNPYFPHNHVTNCVVYTGTHDNNTTLGWFNGLSEDAKKNVYEYFGNSNETMPTLLVRSAFASVASTVIIPLQDLLALDEQGRMNVPGTAEGNWLWRFNWDELDISKVTADLKDLCRLYDR